jgi:hypothetical protein
MFSSVSWLTCVLFFINFSTMVVCSITFVRGISRDGEVSDTCAFFFKIFVISFFIFGLSWISDDIDYAEKRKFCKYTPYLTVDAERPIRKVDPTLRLNNNFSCTFAP